MATVIGSDVATRTQLTKNAGEWQEVWTGTSEMADAKATALIGEYGADSVQVVYDQGIGTVSVRMTPTSGGYDLTWDDASWSLTGSQEDHALGSWPGRADDMPQDSGAEIVNPASGFDFHTNTVAEQAAIQVARMEFQKGNCVFAPTTDRAAAYYEFLKRGVDAYRRSYPILQQSLTVARGSVVKVSWKGVDRAWQLTGEDGSPNPPSEIVGAISEHPDYIEAAPQWLKVAPQIQQLGGGRYAMSHQWIFARSWSWLFYGGIAWDRLFLQTL